jgi:hypothetical protein
MHPSYYELLEWRDFGAWKWRGFKANDKMALIRRLDIRTPHGHSCAVQRRCQFQPTRISKPRNWLNGAHSMPQRSARDASGSALHRIWILDAKY